MTDAGDTKERDVVAPPRVVAVVGAARGVGRSTMARNLAAAAARLGRRVCTLDAAGTARAEGVPTLGCVVAGRARLDDALVADADGFDTLTLAGGPGRASATPSDSVVLAYVDALEPRYDLIFVDTPCGAQARALFFAAAATDVLLVVTPDAQALKQTEAFVRLLAARASRHELLVLANVCQAPTDAAAIGRALAPLASRPPHVRLQSLGWVPADGGFAGARRTRRALVRATPEAPAARAIAEIADRLVHLPPARATGGAQFFFQRLLAQGRAA
jgi:flagellar biosynthesis protein FlhG